MSISDVVSRALFAQLPRSATFAGYASAPGPDKTPISLDMVETLASIGCTLEEIGAVVGVSKRTLQRREQDETFREALRSWSLPRPCELAACAVEICGAGNVKALIWLGKQMLGQRDSGPEGKNNDKIQIPPLIIQTSSDDERRPDKEEEGCSKKK